ncbi:hypothetical protein Esti_000447 [Eimeria stiedai]
MGPLGASRVFGSGAPRPVLSGLGWGPPAAAQLLLPLLLLHVLGLLSSSYASLEHSGAAAVQNGPPLSTHRSFHSKGAPRTGPPEPLAFQFPGPLVRQQEVYGFQRKRGERPHGSVLLANLKGGPLGPSSEALHETPVSFEHQRLRPLFPELQAEPESAASSELTTTRFCDISEIQPVTAQSLEKRGIIHLTNIQLKAFEPVYSGRDVIGRSETGSGKTIAFVLPLLERIARRRAQAVHTPERVQPQLLVLAPTRELARQVQSEVEAVGSPLGLSSVCLYGGVAVQQQLRAVREASERRGRRSGIDVVVSTPGRLIDFMGLQAYGGEAPQNLIHLRDVRHVVLDEADEMLKLGFAEAVETILFSVLSRTRRLKQHQGAPNGDPPPFPSSNRLGGGGPSEAQAPQQVLLFSATQPPWVEGVGRKYLVNPLVVDAINTRTHRQASGFRHVAMELPSALPPPLLASVIRDCVLTFSERDKQSIVFVSTKAMADQLAHAGAASGLMLSSAVLHGGIEQETREKVMQGFRQGRYKALICTDVAARGIDVANVDLVVHCGIAFDSDVFVHRSGRTGRAGRRGLSLLLYTPQEKRELQRLQNTCGIRFESRDLPSVDEVLGAASEGLSRCLDEVAPALMPFFSAAAAQVLERAEAVGVTPRDVVARALAVAAGFKELPSRSLLSLQPGLRTLELVKEKGSWSSAEEGDSWLAKQVLHSYEVPHAWRVGAPRQHADDPTLYFYRGLFTDRRWSVCAPAEQAASPGALERHLPQVGPRGREPPMGAPALRRQRGAPFSSLFLGHRPTTRKRRQGKETLCGRRGREALEEQLQTALFCP